MKALNLALQQLGAEVLRSETSQLRVIKLIRAPICENAGEVPPHAIEMEGRYEYFSKF